MTNRIKKLPVLLESSRRLVSLVESDCCSNGRSRETGLSPSASAAGRLRPKTPKPSMWIFAFPVCQQTMNWPLYTSSESLSYRVRRHRRISASPQRLFGRLGATAFSIWLVDARQHPHYRAAFRAAATCVTRAPWCFATSSSSLVGGALFCPEIDDDPYGVPWP